MNNQNNLKNKFRKTKSFAATVLIGFLAFSACTVNINSNENQNASRNQNTPAVIVSSPQPVATPLARWSVAVCTSRAGEVTLQAGPNENDNQTFVTWRENGPQKIFEFPARLQNLTQIHFRTIGSEAKPVELCVLSDGRPKKRVAFDEGSENHTFSANDDDDNDCRCVE